MLRVCFEGIEQTVALTDLAVVTLPTVGADALVHADFVDAGASIAAWVAFTVVDVWEKQQKTQQRTARCKTEKELMYDTTGFVSRFTLRRRSLVLLSWQ